MHKAKDLYGGWKITFVVADANNRVTAGIDGVMEMCKGVTVVIADAKNRVPTGLVRLAGRESMVLRKCAQGVTVIVVDVNRWR